MRAILKQVCQFIQALYPNIKVLFKALLFRFSFVRYSAYIQNRGRLKRSFVFSANNPFKLLYVQLDVDFSPPVQVLDKHGFNDLESIRKTSVEIEQKNIRAYYWHGRNLTSEQGSIDSISDFVFAAALVNNF